MSLGFVVVVVFWRLANQTKSVVVVILVVFLVAVAVDGHSDKANIHLAKVAN